MEPYILTNNIVLLLDQDWVHGAPRNRLETIEEEFAKSVKLSTTAANQPRNRIARQGSPYIIQGKAVNAETPADRIRGLHAVMKMLFQSPSLERPVDASYAKAAECTIAAALVNLSRPLVLKRWIPCSSEDLKTKERVGGYTYKAEAHMALRAQFLVLANEFFCITGYPGMIYIDKLRVQIIVRSTGHGQQGLGYPIISSFDTNRKAKKKRSPAAVDWVQEVRYMNTDIELAEEEFTKAELNLEEAESKLKVLRSELEPLREAKAESSRNKKRLARRRRQGDKHAMTSVASWIPTGPN
ncbi:hypothetical protein EC957_005440 [Mortierella hygrophila]|uniref:Uncharacterized protein n=1 Tax=Mortierella hygrophila TaxID=979708 RepID=A0A9P6F074_9FUNG|nr:hypothetical protein EC957_005440 [Mortierella hygrophila]